MFLQGNTMHYFGLRTNQMTPIEQIAREYTNAMGYAIMDKAELESLRQAIIKDYQQSTEYESMKADAETIMQILTDPDNQPSQFGTVPLKWYENLENKLEKIRFNVGEVIDSLDGSYEKHAIRKKLQEAIEP